MNKSAFVGRQEILGRDEILGSSTAAKVATAPLKVVRAAVTAPIDILEWTLRRAPTPNKSWFIGDDEKILAMEGGAAEREALARRTSACGYNSHWTYIRGDLPPVKTEDLLKVVALAKNGNKKAKRVLVKLAKLAKSSPDAPNTSSGDDGQEGRHQARQILSSAANSKQITRADLKKAIWLHAGLSSTEKERTLVGSKMIAFLNKHQVKLTG